MPHPRTRTARAAIAGAAVLLAAALGTAAPAAAQTSYKVNYSWSNAFATSLDPGKAPPGANDWSCAPSAAHPRPVVLVHGTFENQANNWQGAAPILANHGYCVFSFNYGGSALSGPVMGIEKIEDGAAQLAAFVDRVRAATGTDKVDLVGHSQGGMMPRYYLKNLGGAAKVHTLVGITPSNHGTDLDGIAELGKLIGVIGPVSAACPACGEQIQGSSFLTALNAGGDTVPGVSYYTIVTKNDEVVTPYTSGELTGPNTTNVVLQDQCRLDQSDHLEAPYSPVVLHLVLNALDPDHPGPVPCQVVLPLTGPTGPVTGS
ncbi:MAG TPA: alpha/beta fold hydrolase [Streptosporangiaceae bacterium]|jgi:triacylglycerol esterase/lipase EstA (alpha/beta hydrolase family)